MTDTPELAPAADPAGAGPSPDDGWQTAKNGRQYVGRPGGGYPIWRKGSESVQEAQTRAAETPPDRAPRSKRRRAAASAAVSGAGKLPPRSRDDTTRAIEEACAGILTAPAIGCAMFGDEWGANHFQIQGERFAANLARSSEHNPWLRAKLEKLTEGEATIAAILTSVSLTAGAVGYIAPPLIKYLDLPAPATARRMLGVPLSDSYVMPAAEYEPPAGEAGAVPVTDALSDPEQLAAMAAMFGAVNGEPADQGANMPSDGTDPDQGLSQPA